MLKRISTILLSLCMLFSLVACGDTPANPNDDPKDNSTNNVEYFIWWTDTIISGLTEEGLKQTNLVIPAKCVEVGGIESSVLKKVTFENPDTVISGSGFSGCTALVSIELPANLKEIQIFTFKDCTSLKSIIIPDSVTKIGSSAFDGCASLENVTLGKEVVTIKSSAFEGCGSLTEINIPDSVTTIESSAFRKCSSLVSLSLGAGLETIERSAFRECVSLKKVVIPEGVKILEAYAFAFCDAMEEVYLPKSIEEISSSSIAQTHNFKVYLYEGSYCDQMFDTLMSPDYMDKNYR